MSIAAILGAGGASRWLPAERFVFVSGWIATLAMLVAATALEFSSQSSWVYQFTSDQEFTRPLPSDTEIIAQARHLPVNAVRFKYTTSDTDLFGLTTNRTYVGFYDPACQGPINVKRRACAKAGYPLLSTGSDLRCVDYFSLNPKAPADRCVLWGFGDHYLARVTTTYWKLDRLFGSRWFQLPFGIAIASFLNLFLIGPIWLRLWDWIAK
jgi:hypothetical protein